MLGGIAVNTDTEIVALTPPHAAGTVDLTVNIAGKKKITLPAAFTFEDSTTYERLLLPVVVSNAPGAFGSIWTTEVLLSNNTDAAVSIQNVVIQPHQSVSLPAANEPNGVFLLVPRGNVDVQLRVRDLSREAQTFGTSIPVVRTTEFRPIVRIHGVPTDSRFRSTLRIYNYPGESGAVRLQIFDEATGALLVSNTVTAFIQPVPPFTGHDRVRIEVDSNVDPPRPIWAFVSITNNETQHVTVIAPSP